MLRNFIKNRKAQNTAEYALLIALVVAGCIAMQTFCQRAFQARMHDVSQYMANSTSYGSDGNRIMGNSTQYEPYYLVSNYSVNSESAEQRYNINTAIGINSMSNRERQGYQNQTYDGTGVTVDSNAAQQ